MRLEINLDGGDKWVVDKTCGWLGGMRCKIDLRVCKWSVGSKIMKSEYDVEINMRLEDGGVDDVEKNDARLINVVCGMEMLCGKWLWDEKNETVYYGWGWKSKVCCSVHRRLLVVKWMYLM